MIRYATPLAILLAFTLGGCQERCFGPCCDSSGPLDAGSVCDETTEYRCVTSACGSGREERTVHRYCTGFSSECDGRIEEGPWSPLSSCSPDEVCDYREAACSGTDCTPGVETYCADAAQCCGANSVFAQNESSLPTCECAAQQCGSECCAAGTCDAGTCATRGAVALLAAATGQQEALALAPLADGSFAVAGGFFGAMTMGSSLLSSRGVEDGFVARIDGTGGIVWSKHLGGPYPDYVSGLAALPDGGVVVAGVAGPASELEPGTLVPRGGFIARYDVDGVLQWRAVIEGVSECDYPRVRYGGDTVLVAGRLSSITRFAAGESAETTLLADNGLFLAAYSPSGTFLWARAAIGGADCDGKWGFDVNVDGVVALSSKTSLASFTPDSTRAWVAEGTNHGSSVVVRSDGAVFRWAAEWTPWARRSTLALFSSTGAREWDRDSLDTGTLALLADGGVAVSHGVVLPFEAGSPSDPGFTRLVYAALPASGIAVARYDASGALDWIKLAASGNAEVAALVPSGNDLVGFGTATDATFGVGEPTEAHVGSSAPAAVLWRVGP